MKKMISIFLSLSMFLNSIPFTVFASEAKENKLLAFPTAEGGGMYTKGARAADNFEIYHVTNLNDSGEGSFRDAVSQSNRIIVFDVGGTIFLKSILKVRQSNLTILGQTAPGEGICIAGDSVEFWGKDNSSEETAVDNIIIRYMRFRMGDTFTDPIISSDQDALGVRYGSNIILDHCSVSWSTDECLSCYGVKNFTAQWCIVSESLNSSLHGKGSHGYGGIWGGINSSFHHNLITNHSSRNPRIAGTTVGTYLNTPQSDSAVDIRNNVFYAWGYGAGYGGENGVRVNFVNNYYKPIEESKKIIYLSYDYSKTNIGSCVYASGNVMEDVPEITENNKLGLSSRGYEQSLIICNNISDGITENGVFKPNDQYIYDYPVATDTAEEAYERVINQAGASLKRDMTDTRVINNVINKTLPVGRVSGEGFIDSQDDVGGWCRLVTADKAADTDGDGIPDEWEDKNSLDKNDPTDAAKFAESGYTNIEEYANSLVANENERKHIDKYALYNEIERTENLKKEKYISEYFGEELADCDYIITSADITLLASDLTEEKLNAKAEELKNANDLIVNSVLYKLISTIVNAEKIKYNAYTNKSWDDFQNALKKAYNLINAGGDDKAYLNAAEEIEKAVSALTQKGNSSIKLINYINMKSKENNYDYFDEDWDNFQSELESAREFIYANEDITYEQAEEIIDKINAVFDGMRTPYYPLVEAEQNFEDDSFIGYHYKGEIGSFWVSNNTSIHIKLEVCKNNYGNDGIFLKKVDSRGSLYTDIKGKGVFSVEFSFYESGANENNSSQPLLRIADRDQGGKNILILESGDLSQDEWHRVRVDFDLYENKAVISADGNIIKETTTNYSSYYPDDDTLTFDFLNGGNDDILLCIDDISIKRKVIHTETPYGTHWGDVDMDNKITANDAALILSYLSGTQTLTDEQLYNASVLGINKEITNENAKRVLNQVFNIDLKKTIDDIPYTDEKNLTTTETTTESTTETTTYEKINNLDTDKMEIGDYDQDYSIGDFIIGKIFSIIAKEIHYDGNDFLDDPPADYSKAILIKGGTDIENPSGYIKVDLKNDGRLTILSSGIDGKMNRPKLYKTENGEYTEIMCSMFNIASSNVQKYYYDDLTVGEYIIIFDKADSYVYDVELYEK